MNLPDKIDIKNFNYDLPEHRIAKYPLNERDSSKLLYYNEGNISSYKFSELPDLLNQNSLLIFNDTRVIMARLKLRKESGSEIEIFLLEPYNPSEYYSAFQEKKECIWKCLVGNAKKWKQGSLFKTIIIHNNPVILKCIVVGIENNYRLISFTWDNEAISFSELIEKAGLTPIPPYLAREPEAIDIERYQTVYSYNEGSVASPTAGLHFTNDIFTSLEEKGIKTCKLTLHVGAGTFLPVKSSNAINHDMHIEHFSISKSCISELLNMEKVLIPVGTTSLRTIETLYWLGVKYHKKQALNNHFFLDQWEAYHLQTNLSIEQSLSNILEYMEVKNLDYLNASTKIMIIPGYSFRMAEGLITNFHQPHSTLLLLVAAFTGSDWKRIYSYALDNDYRFLSYGDSSLLMK